MYILNPALTCFYFKLIFALKVLSCGTDEGQAFSAVRKGSAELRENTC